MSTSISIHDARSLRSDFGSTTGYPLTIRGLSPNNLANSEVVFFLHDMELAMAVSKAINEAVRSHEAKKWEVATEHAA